MHKGSPPITEEEFDAYRAIHRKGDPMPDFIHRYMYEVELPRLSKSIATRAKLEELENKSIAKFK